MPRVLAIGPAGVLVIVSFGLASLAIDGFASVANLTTVAVSAVPLLLLAIGQTFVLLTAGIDLSATAIVGLVSIAGGLVASEETGWLRGHPLAAAGALVVMLSTGIGVGLLNGSSVAVLRMPAFMVTLATGMFAGGLAVWAARLSAGSETMFGLPLAVTAIGAHGWSALLLAALTTTAAHLLLARGIYGRRLQAVGFNPRTARVSGVAVSRVVIVAYALSGLSAALAALVLTGSLDTASPTHGRQLLLDVIGATVIGGTSLNGGRGSITGTALGVVFLALVGNALTLLNLSDFVVTIVKGLVILGAAIADVAQGRFAGFMQPRLEARR